jgi:hypothetical protein
MQQLTDTSDRKPVEYEKPEVADFGSLFELTAGGFGGPRQDCIWPTKDGWLCGWRSFS